MDNRELLSHAPLETVTLPMDRERPPVCSFLRKTATTKLPMPHAPTQSLPATLLASLAAVVYRYTEIADMVLGCVIESAGKAKLIAVPLHASPEQSAETWIQHAAMRMEAAAHETISAGSFRIAMDFSLGGGDFADEITRCDVVASAKEVNGELGIACEYDSELFNDSTIERFLQHWKTIFESMVSDGGVSVATLPMLSQEELHRLFVQWNDTVTDISDSCIHQLFESQAQRDPEKTAVIFERHKLTYRELNARANQLARKLQTIGVGPEMLVGICVERSLEMIVGLLAILKAGCAYVPLDPHYPRERIASMIEDASLQVILTQERLGATLTEHAVQFVCIDSGLFEESGDNLPRSTHPRNLAYVIYTSGSTGKPKGVMITHRNVVNFFAGMDERIDVTPGVWLAVTSISFDISVLELFWTLTRGFTVVIARSSPTLTTPSAPAAQAPLLFQEGEKNIDFSLFYFASDEGQDAGNRYRLLLEGARFADEHGFAAVWTPERHFHAFGGLYPNPSVTSAAVAAITKRVQIRAGSVVLPLQNPIRVAEEWSVVDNLSGGRVAVSFASGWQINDFVLAPRNYESRKAVMLEGIETVRKLWRGETARVEGVDGREIDIRILPRPVQPDLPLWLTATGSPETCRIAGEIGANLLTHLVGQNIEELAEKIRIYREAWKNSGREGDGRVTLMLHTFIGESIDTVRETVRQPFSNYLKTSVDLLKNSPWGFAPARLSAKNKVRHLSHDSSRLSEDESAELVDHAFDKYFETSSLFGTPESCQRMVEAVRQIGVDEIACLIDFGVDSQTVLDSLPLLNKLRERCNVSSSQDQSLATMAKQYGVTHFQCTPSMAGMLSAQPENHEWLRQLEHFVIGGETLPASLAERLRELTNCRLHNMYGPTETTVWSTTHAIDNVETVSIGRPIANTTIYLLDSHAQPVPAGLPGELCIGGAGVARGYWKRPELTAERFIPDRFSDEPDGRVYCTGDRARYREDGSLEFLGRMDGQVKIRGHRVEVAEIEAALGEIESVAECAIVVREDASGDKRVVAYVALRRGEPRKAHLLRTVLLAALPDYMCPSTFVFVDRLPRTPNGKIDRRGLPAAAIQPIDENRFVAPRSPVEEILADMWADLLSIDRVGAHDNFFELGGHSLLATQLITRLREVFRIDLPVAAIFDATTVADLAEYMIAHESRPGLVERTAQLLRDIAAMSEEEIGRAAKYREAS